MAVFRAQRTIARPAEVDGFAFFCGADVHLRFLPAAEGAGIRFRRTDLTGSPEIPALIDYVVPRPRRTAISHGGATVEMIEHVMAALAGLQIDNCTVELDAPEPPGCDGSSLEFVQRLLDAGIVEQSAPRDTLVVAADTRLTGDPHQPLMSASPLQRHGFAITYHLDYGPRSPIPPQVLTVEITPENFITQLAYARTFLLEAEAAQLKAAGIGQKVTARDILIFSEHGPIENALRSVNECVRHKLLDCVGDLALIGSDLHGHFRAVRTGHAHNHEILRALIAQRALQPAGPGRLGLLADTDCESDSAAASPDSPSEPHAVSLRFDRAHEAVSAARRHRPAA